MARGEPVPRRLRGLHLGRPDQRVAPADPGFTAGRAHHLGDYFATGEFAERMYHWSMSPADDRYEFTMAEMKRIR